VRRVIVAALWADAARLWPDRPREPAGARTTAPSSSPFPRAWTAGAAPRVHGRCRPRLPRERWAHVGERMCTDSIAMRRLRAPGGLRAVDGATRP